MTRPPSAFDATMNSTGSDRPVIVFDILGTLVDQAGSLRRQVSAVTGWDEVSATSVVTTWLDLVAKREHEIISGSSAFAPSHVLDAEALERIAAEGELPMTAVQPLSDAAQRLEPWPDAVEGLTRLAADVTLMGLSNASRRVLTGLSGRSGMRWHQVLSAEDANTYKPDPAIYRVALSAAPVDAPPPYFVAAHAWDLRAAAKAGLRTAYVPRPNGDPPADNDTFELYAENLIELHAKLQN
ncbi:haloacid dehalogenase type II [Ornithinimicrobium faecis]|uniref:haloacid dehalogenase type II n=1 Tax=Ornithinimicrobium faecis TaxID=2934158 RepID=UPI0021174BC5|nr:haloacid dehalogenase type II [Ornithinimicrobium sp. HY1745]